MTTELHCGHRKNLGVKAGPVRGFYRHRQNQKNPLPQDVEIKFIFGSEPKLKILIFQMLKIHVLQTLKIRILQMLKISVFRC